MQSQTSLGELNPCGGGDPIPLLHDKLLVGRRSSCDISLRFPNVSSHHCQLELKNGYWTVRDLGSKNGVKVNGEQIETKVLMPGDVLSVAKHEFEVLYTPDTDAPVPEEENPFARGLLEKAGLATDRPRRSKEKTETATTEEKKPATPKVRPRNQDDFYLEWFGEV